MWLHLTLLLGLLRELQTVTREYNIAAVEFDWDYHHSELLDRVSSRRQNFQRSQEEIQKYTKAVYWEYTDSTFTRPKSKPSWMGILGPTIKAEVNDKVIVNFKNFASRPYSVNPIGITYWKQSEGAGYNDETSKSEKGDDEVAPGDMYTYTWEIQPETGPMLSDPQCLTYSYSSHVNPVKDFNSGLIGALLICKPGTLKSKDIQPAQDIVLLFSVFDESQTWYANSDQPTHTKQLHCINGYVNSTLPDLKVCLKSKDQWHLIGMGTGPEIHSVHFQDHTLLVQNHRRISFDMTPVTFASAQLNALKPGKFLVSCQLHQNAGMVAYFIVEACAVEMSNRKVNQDHEDEEYYYNYEDILEGLQEIQSPLQVRSSVKLQSKIWVHFIAVEEITWDYAPDLYNLKDRKLASLYLEKNSKRIGKQYKKAVYSEYTDGKFTTRIQKQEKDKGIMGPVLRGEVGDEIRIVFKNLASRPYNIYPQGLTSVRPFVDSGPAKGKNLKFFAIKPNESFIYSWNITSEDGPTSADPRCLTRIYSSTIDPIKDVASGLIGPLIICYKKTLDTRGKVIKSDKEKHLLFAVFDENQSWYINENIQQYCTDCSNADRTSIEFYKSNLMNSINGYLYDNLHFKVCLGDIAFWHVMYIGAQNEFFSVYFSGNTFQLDNMYEVVLTLFPMSAETVYMEFEKMGEWIIGALDSNIRDRGMRAKYTVYNCDREDKNMITNPEEDDYYEVLDYIEQRWSPRGFNEKNRIAVIKLCKKMSTFNATSGPQNGTAKALNPNCKIKSTQIIEDKISKAVKSLEEPTDDGTVSSNLMSPTDIKEDLQSSSMKSQTALFSQEESATVGEKLNKPGTTEVPDITMIPTIPISRSLHSGANGIAGIPNHTISGETYEHKVEENREMRYQRSVDSQEKRRNINSGNMTLNLPQNIANSEKKYKNGSLKSEKNISERMTTVIPPARTHNKRTENKILPQTNKLKTNDAKFKTPTEKGRLLNINTFLNETNKSDKKFNVSERNKERSTHHPQMELSKINENISNSENINLQNSFIKEHPKPDKSMFDSGGEVKGNDRINKNNLHEEGSDVKSTQIFKRENQKEHNSQHENQVLKDLGTKELLNLNQTNEINKSTVKTIKSEKEVKQNVTDSKKTEQKTEEVQVNSSAINQLPGKNPDASYYDEYSLGENDTQEDFDIYDEGGFNVRTNEGRIRYYFIAAVEVMWNFGIKKTPQETQSRSKKNEWQKSFPEYKKVIFREYLDSEFTNMAIRGEMEEHLGILGPVIRAEINDFIVVIFRNLASRPYSFHLHGVYDKVQNSHIYEASKEASEAVQPNETQKYSWKVTKREGPTNKEFDCKTWAYYSNLNTEKDIHSGLIGPLLICKPGTLSTVFGRQLSIQEYSLFFMVFDENKSWYMDENISRNCPKQCQIKRNDEIYKTNNMFPAINGYTAETLPGLLAAHHEVTRWHLLSMGNFKEAHAVHFHGQTFTFRRNDQEHRTSVYNLYPGTFGTIEMTASKVGSWLIECRTGNHQLTGMRAKFLIYNPKCTEPLGMMSGVIQDEQITSSGHYGDWQPKLARLDFSGSINAWSGLDTKSWIQVDLLRPMLIHGIKTQGAKQFFSDYYIAQFLISYSSDNEKWKRYKGNVTNTEKIFGGNVDGSAIKGNVFSPPIVARYIKIHPLSFNKRPTLRMELIGCDLNSCSLPLGMERGLIQDNQISASSFFKNWVSSWTPSLARLNLQGRINAWRPKVNNPHEWFQVDFMEVKRITGIITQGAKEIFTYMFIKEFSISVSNDGVIWSDVQEDDGSKKKVFQGNQNTNESNLNIFDPPLFSRYIRIYPTSWNSGIALRVEFLGCDTQQ
ncbi:coagulation factor VIII [Polypterus senegalus]|uniref:coagulation factor VIII n=1 Tax=Polypterus senegalus TaxID=55291 RepID=UPI001965E758|nr:coagulation factor VIII [Polypterus senegalus]